MLLLFRGDLTYCILRPFKRRQDSATMLLESSPCPSPDSPFFFCFCNGQRARGKRMLTSAKTLSTSCCSGLSFVPYPPQTGPSSVSPKTSPLHRFYGIVNQVLQRGQTALVCKSCDFISPLDPHSAAGAPVPALIEEDTFLMIGCL